MAGSQRKVLLVLLLLIHVLVGTGGGIGAAFYHYRHNDIVCPGAVISRVPVGGLNYKEARELLNEQLKSPSYLSFTWKESAFRVDLDENVARFALDRAFQDAAELCSINREWHHFFNVVRWFPHGRDIIAPLTVSYPHLKEMIEDLKSEVVKEPEDATIIIEEGHPRVLAEKQGRKIDINKSIETAVQYLAEGCYEQIPLQVKIVQPAVTAKSLPDYSAVLAYHETPLDEDNTDRNYNIMLALRAIHGIVIEPGEVFSFNETIGPVTAKKGYREVLVIRNRKFVPGIGGGICQVATTLYGVALRTELEIVQRSNHSRPVSYVPLGQDATVAQHIIDLKIRNNRDFPVMLVGDMNSYLRIVLFGAESDPHREVKIVSEDIETISPRLLEQPDPSLPVGVRQQVQEGEEGYRVNVYRVFYEEGVEAERELVSTDVYLPVNEVVRVGIKKQINK